MKILVDTSIWSLSLRRKQRDLSAEERQHALMLRDLISSDSVFVPGIVRQELLSGVRDEKQFEKLRDYLEEFEDRPLSFDDYAKAAECFNRCMGSGITPSQGDMLICALSINLDLAIYTVDADFANYAKVLKLQLETLTSLQKKLRP